MIDQVPTPPARRFAAKLWRRPEGQPTWQRPVLAALAVLAAAAYAWGMGGDAIEMFYGAAARSMSQSWHDFFFGAFDPAGTVTLDKLPGAVWIQALSLRLFGFHIWAIVLPQVVEGVLTVLVLFRAVGRLAGPVAGAIAAGIQALSPATVLLNRGNISDTLLILLLVLAADAASAAVVTGRTGSLVLAGVWVGLAFQAKSLQAWVVLPALAVAYLLAGSGDWQKRLRQCGLFLPAAIIVSLSWMSVVSLVPAHDRPYVDGSRNDSEFSQVFVYNGVARMSPGTISVAGTPAPFVKALVEDGDTLGAPTIGIKASWHRLLSGAFARDDAWLFPPALVSIGWLVVARRRRALADPIWAASLLWAIWLLLHIALFSSSTYIQPYYLAALTPAVGALVGIAYSHGLSSVSRHRFNLAVALTAVGSLAYGAVLVGGASSAPAVVAAALGVGAVAALCALVGSAAAFRRTLGVQWTAVTLGLGAAATMLLPLAVSASAVAQGLGPFDTPLQSPSVTKSDDFSMTRLLTLNSKYLAYLQFQMPANQGIVLATDTSLLAAPFILATGVEVLPIGGYFGGIPSPTLGQLENDVDSGRVRYVRLAVRPLGNDPRVTWLVAHCHSPPFLPQPRNRKVWVWTLECSPGGSS